MQRAAAIVILAAVCLPACQARIPEKAAAVSAEDAQREVRQIIQDRKAADGRGDVKAWRSHIADDCLWVGAQPGVVTSADAALDVGRNASSGKTATLANMRFAPAGDAMVVTYQEDDRTTYNGRDILSSFNYLDTYVRRGGTWTLIASSETPIPPVPDVAKAVRIDPRILATYVGRYQFLPNSILTVTLEGDRLMGRADGEQPSPFFAENATTFFDEGHSWRWIFVKDGAGRVTHMIFRSGGHDYEMPRLK